MFATSLDLLPALTPVAPVALFGSRMKRAAIRKALDEALAARGFARGWYGWTGCWLECHSMGGLRLHRGKYPSGMSRKRLLEAIEGIQFVGPARALPQFEKADTYRQTDISEFTGEGRR